MVSILKLKDVYKITFKNVFFKREYPIKPFIDDFTSEKSDEIENKLKNIYNLEFKEIKGSEFVVFSKSDFLESLNLCFYKILDSKGIDFLVMEILDIAIRSKYRKKGIGTQIMIILNEIALKNNVKFIAGELQEDRVDQPLEGRKRFFERNGFKIWENKKSRFSGWVIKKSL